jgi:hypothetical protein
MKMSKKNISTKNTNKSIEETYQSMTQSSYYRLKITIYLMTYSIDVINLCFHHLHSRRVYY